MFRFLRRPIQQRRRLVALPLDRSLDRSVRPPAPVRPSVACLYLRSELSVGIHFLARTAPVHPGPSIRGGGVQSDGCRRAHTDTAVVRVRGVRAPLAHLSLQIPQVGRAAARKEGSGGLPGRPTDGQTEEWACDAVAGAGGRPRHLKVAR